MSITWYNFKDQPHIGIRIRDFYMDGRNDFSNVLADKELNRILAVLEEKDKMKDVRGAKKNDKFNISDYRFSE